MCVCVWWWWWGGGREGREISYERRKIRYRRVRRGRTNLSSICDSRKSNT